MCLTVSKVLQKQKMPEITFFMLSSFASNREITSLETTRIIRFPKYPSIPNLALCSEQFLKL